MSNERVSQRLTLDRAAVVAVNVLIFWIGVPLLAVALGRFTESTLGLAPLPTAARLGGLVPLFGGAWLCLRAAQVLIVRGKGLPISSLPPTRLVRTGPYRALRHPIYTGFAALMLGTGMVIGSAGLAFVVVPVAFALWLGTWVKLYEEPGLVRRFGWSYRAHRRHTGLLVPFGLRRLLRAALLWLFRRAVRVRLEGGAQVITGRAAIYVCDHLSYLDLLLAACCAPGPMAIPVTAEVFRSRLGRVLVGILGGIPRRRYAPRSNTAKRLQGELAIGSLVGIAVEGERSWNGHLGPLAPGVARFIARCDVPIVPVAMVGSYRLWPRWARKPDRSAPVTVRVGEPFRVNVELADRAVEALIRERIAALRDPAEAAVDPSSFPGARPELALWRCPICGVAERLGMQGPRRLRCAACGADWLAGEGRLTLLKPVARAGESRTLAGWVGVASKLQGEHELLVTEAELRSAPADTPATARLPSRGMGRAVLHRGRIEWHGAGGARVVSFAALRTVTTERADTLQLATEDEVLQLVLPEASPLRWQQTIERLRVGAMVTGHDSAARMSARTGAFTAEHPARAGER